MIAEKPNNILDYKLNYQTLKSELNNLKYSLDGVSYFFDWSIPTSTEHGLFTSNIAFRLTKVLKQSPVLIADEILEMVSQSISGKAIGLEPRSIAGYINLVPNSDLLNSILQTPVQIQNQIEKSDRRVLLDYVGANVAKRLHVGHMRNINIGDSLRRILKLRYSNLVTDNHWGDWGVQFGVLLWGWKELILKQSDDSVSVTLQDYHQDPIETLTKIYVWANAQESVSSGWAELVRAEFLKLESGDAENLKLWSDFVNVSKKDLKKDLKLLGVPDLDLEQGESFYEPDMKFLTVFLDDHRIWKAEDKARFFDFEELGQIWQALNPDLGSQFFNKINKLGRSYLISSSGYTTYCFRDVAARLQWARDLKADFMITVADKTQAHNFDQAFTIISFLADLKSFQATQSIETLKRLQAKNMLHVGYGFMSLPEGKMSTRKGNVVSLRSLFQQVQAEAKENLAEKSSELSKIESKQNNSENIDQTKSHKITVAALKWFDLARDSWGDMVLDIPQILKFEGNTGVYQLYTYARLKSILRKFEALLETNAKPVNTETLNQSESLILQHIFMFSETLEQSVQTLKPHLIANFLYSLCDQINSWYNTTSILKEPDPIRQQTLLVLLQKASEQLKFGLDLLGIEVIEEI
jgi:arginyl-tRNA synthetase